MANDYSQQRNSDNAYLRGLSQLAPNVASWYDQKTNAYKYDSQLQQEAYEQNLALQMQQQDYEANMSNTEYQRQVADMQAAGLNVGAMGGGGGGTASSAGGTGLSNQTPSQTRSASNGHSDEGIEQATQALMINAIIETAQKHPEQVIEYIKKAEHKVNNTAREMIYNG